MLLGHVHTHEFAAGGTTDQVGNPWALERSAGGSSGGSAAALASRHGARRRPARTRPARCASRRRCAARRRSSRPADLVPMRGIVPLSADASTTPGRWPAACATASRCSPRWRASRRRPSAGRCERIAVSPRDRRPRPGRRRRASTPRSRRSPAKRVEPPPPPAPLDLGTDFADVALHRDARLPPPLRRPARALPAVDRRRSSSTREQRAMTAEEYVAAQARRAETTAAWATGSPSTGSTRSSSRRCRSSRARAGTATTRRSPTSPRSR